MKRAKRRGERERERRGREGERERERENASTKRNASGRKCKKGERGTAKERGYV